MTNVGGERDCIACSMCVMACPFGVIARAPAPNGRVMALKCDLCPGRDVPACVAACPTGALVLKQGNELVPASATAPAVAHDALVSLSAGAIAKVLWQLQPDDGASEPSSPGWLPKAVVEKLLAMLDERRNGMQSQAR